jgi:hypothetical protein
MGSFATGRKRLQVQRRPLCSDRYRNGEPLKTDAKAITGQAPRIREEYGTSHQGRAYRGIPSVRLGPSLKDHVERPRRRPSNPRKPAVANDLGELGLTRLRTQAFAYFLVQ